MILRTTFDIEPSAKKIDYQSHLMFVGSCFAAETGKKLSEAKFKVMINPFGTVYNPVSVANTLDLIISNKEFSRKDLFINNNVYFSFYHYTDFTSSDPDKLIEKINNCIRSAHEFLKKTEFLFVTFGTARVYKLRENGMIVSNCHKLPSSFFTNELLSVEEITDLWTPLLGRISNFSSSIKVVFTISPVRYLKDGVHGNQVSKSVLFLAVERLLEHYTHPIYFPAYELLMDDLRDYRFYADDMVHPSTSAFDYIFNAFSCTFFDNNTMSEYRDVTEIIKAYNHKLISFRPEEVKKFAETSLMKIDKAEKRIEGIDLSCEREYFKSLLEKSNSYR